ncbi:MAG: S-methyl-5-thioribose-1-phosphate isomerase [Elusimicrobiales bacterium]|nr:S-methyl-5-thioribose-1-phosphate isomerase [Elusimicrobiales bacterium]
MTPPRLIYRNGTLRIMDQRLLPDRVAYIPARTAAAVAKATKDMALRGAPLIGCAAAFGFALELRRLRPGTPAALRAAARRTAELLKAARPTAVALFYAADRMLARALEFADAHPRPFGPAEKRRLVSLLEKEARLITAEDARACLDIGRHGARLLPKNCVIMTHCNAGALATMGIGTAVGVITEGRRAGKVKRAYACETRPYLQGARLTVWELMREKVPSELITDNMAAHIIKTCGVNAIVVGADRIAANGDTANKVGTYGLAIIARHHGVPFYVAAPTPTVDMEARSGDAIEIEERSCGEVVVVKGRRIAPRKVRARHPAFDVTPAGLITALITERGVISPVNVRNIGARLA